MADKLTLLAGDAELLQRLGLSAAKKVRARYSTETTAPRLLRIIESLLQQPVHVQ